MEPEQNQSFSLLDGPWILARFTDGATAEVSIRDAFTRAEEIREIVGELPTQSFAILRLLLAILYQAHEDVVSMETWATWHRRSLPQADIDDYLGDFEDRFDLFDRERPFFQVAELATAKGERKDVTPLIADLPSNNRLFTNRSGKEAESLSFAEAARWLVHAQAYDVSGIKSGARGDPRVRGGKGYPIGTGFCGLLGGVYAQGRTLKETLLLNLVPQGSDADADLVADIPPWEELAPDNAAERPGLVPRGPVRLYTWQSRRIRLFPEGDRVVACLVANGDKVTPQNMQTWEPLSAWRFSEPQTRTAKQTTYMPREHLVGRSLWRGISSLLPGIAPIVPKRDVPSGLVPGVVTWLARLDDAGLIEASMRIRLRAVGMVYGSQSSVVADVVDDQVLLPIALLRESNRALARQAEEAVRLAEDGVRAIRRLAENLERAAGGNGESNAPHAMESAWAALDAAYRNWLITLDDERDPLDAIASWKATAYAVLRSLGSEFITQAGPAAWVGREVPILGLVTTPRAEGWFLSALSKTFGSPLRKDAVA